MAKLWEKSKQKSHPFIEKYTAGQDHIFDAFLMPFDIQASRVHAKGLRKIGILDAGELKKILATLDLLEREFRAGKIKITAADEDCHTVIENYLVSKLGGTGKKIHTGRSRNDQVLVALRLYMKDRLAEIHDKCLGLASAFLLFAENNRDIPLPGYSHTRQAMLSSVSHWTLSFVESLLDDLDYLIAVSKHIDKNPLGSAAGFGVSIPIDREFTTQELGFTGLQVNSLYCQNSRGKFESLFLEALVQIMLTLGKFVNDLLLFTSSESGFFRVDAALSTGSSIMPHKHNLDALEILRGNTSVVIAHQLMVKEISKNLLSGYNRDFQLLKKPLMESARIVLEGIEVAGIFIKDITPCREEIETKIDREMFMADIANTLVMEKHIPFRDAYQKAASAVSLDNLNLKDNLVSKVTLGAPGNLAFALYHERIKKQKELSRATKTGFQKKL